MKLKRFDQSIYGGQNGCTYACKLSVDDYFSVNTKSTINAKWLSRVKVSGLKDSYLSAYYKASGYKVNSFKGLFDGKSYSWIANEMKNGRVVHLTWKSSAGGHASLISRIRYLNDFSKVRFNLMNPANSSRTLFSTKRFISIFSLKR